MSKQNIILNYFIFFAFILSFSKVLNFPDHIDRHNNNYRGTYDCFRYNGTANEKNIMTADDCFEESPRTKWKCCFFTYNNETGCMRARKGDDEDLNDLKYYVSKLSSETTFNCKQNYLEYSFVFIISLLSLFI